MRIELKNVVIALLLVFAIIVVVVVKLRHRSVAANTETVWVQTSVAKESALPVEAHAIGTLVARSVEITPEIAGHVATILFHDGVFVKRDTVLIQLDDAVYKAKYASAKAKYDYSQNNYRRMALLGKQGAIAKQAIEQADADMKEKKADADESEVMMSKMKLVAPFDGVIGKSKINTGDYVTVGQALVTLTDTKHLRIEYNVPEKYLSELKPGQDVSITASTYPDKQFVGYVSFISPTINTDNRSVSLYADVANDKNLLAPGMFVNITHSLDREEHVLMLPARSLVPVIDGEQVYKVVDGKAYPVTVTVGKRDGDNVQITKGLSPGDVVITDGQMKVKNGMPVKIKNDQLKS